MSKKILFILLSIVLVSTSCKKKKTDPTPDPAPAGNSTTSATTFNGWCRVYNQYDYLIGSSGPVDMISFGRAFFTTNAISTTNGTQSFTYTFGGQVIANAPLDTLQWFGNIYEKNLAAIKYTVPVKWKVAGNGSVPSFTASCSETFPTCSSLTVFPTTISKSGGLSITFGGFTNADRVIFNVQDNSGNVTSNIEVVPNGSGNAVFNVPASETSLFINTNLGAANLIIYNDEIQTVGGTNIRFSNITQYWFHGFNIVN